MAYVDEEKVTLVKLHGTVDQKDTIVVTGDDYYDVFARLPRNRQPGARLLRHQDAALPGLWPGR